MFSAVRHIVAEQRTAEMFSPCDVNNIPWLGSGGSYCITEPPWKSRVQAVVKTTLNWLGTFLHRAANKQIEPG